LPFWATVSGLFGAALVCSGNHERRWLSSFELIGQNQLVMEYYFSLTTNQHQHQLKKQLAKQRKKKQ
jgi:hypothetical protein